MLPVFTTTQVKDGIDIGDLMLDLSDYMKKKDAATKTDINALTAALANKLDATPQHKHQIDDIKQLQNALDGKLDTSLWQGALASLTGTPEHPCPKPIPGQNKSRKNFSDAEKQCHNLYVKIKLE